MKAFTEYYAESLGVTAEYAKKCLQSIFLQDLIHDGDCVKNTQPCQLCLLETSLAEYRELYLNKHAPKEDIVKIECGKCNCLYSCEKEHFA